MWLGCVYTSRGQHVKLRVLFNHVSNLGWGVWQIVISSECAQPYSVMPVLHVCTFYPP